MIGKLTRVPLREVWKHEAQDFTTWLEDNIDVLNEVLDMTVTVAEREKSAGSFNVDLVGEDEDGHMVVIENQLGRSDHDHLGKVLTYLSFLDARAAIWIVASPRPEHVSAIGWLNEATSTPFYLVQVEAVKIGDSPPAPLFTKIVGPSVEAQAAGQTKKEMSERYTIRKRLWTLVLATAKGKTKLHSSISPGVYNWIGTSAGVRGLSLNYSVRQHDTQVELYIDAGDHETNKGMFEALHVKKEVVEKSFGEALEWQRLEGKRACRIRHRIEIGGWRDESKWPDIAEASVDAMIRLEKALRPHIKKLGACVVARSVAQADLVGRPRLTCRFDDFSERTPLFRIIASALDVAASYHERSCDYDPSPRQNARKLRRYLAPIPSLPRVQAVHVARRLRLGHMERDWQAALSLARMVLEDRQFRLNPSHEDTGPVVWTTDTAQIWEEIIAEAMTPWAALGCEQKKSLGRIWKGLGNQQKADVYVPRVLNAGPDAWVLDVPSP